MWLAHFVGDYLKCLGAVVLVGLVVVIAFFDGTVSGFSAGWILCPPSIYAWLVGEFYRWGKE